VAVWFGWQVALYALVLGVICLFLIPLTSLWWIVPVLGAAVPIALSLMHSRRTAPAARSVELVKEQELLAVLAARGTLTAPEAAQLTSCTVDEGARILARLEAEGQLALRPAAGDGAAVYALPEGGAVATATPHRTPRLTPDQVREPSPLDDPLSEREREVLALLASGRTTSEAARDLFVSVGTIKSHTANIYRKLDARNRAEAIARARELGLLP
jgi:ATP/maltotriose-dependent transcriptional regulator MalT